MNYLKLTKLHHIFQLRNKKIQYEMEEICHIYLGYQKNKISYLQNVISDPTKLVPQGAELWCKFCILVIITKLNKPDFADIRNVYSKKILGWKAGQQEMKELRKLSGFWNLYGQTTIHKVEVIQPFVILLFRKKKNLLLKSCSVPSTWTDAWKNMNMSTSYLPLSIFLNAWSSLKQRA